LPFDLPEGEDLPALHLSSPCHVLFDRFPEQSPLCYLCTHPHPSRFSYLPHRYYCIFASLLCGFGFNLVVGILHVVIGSSTGNLPIEYGLGAIFGLLCGLTFGGLAAIQIKIVQWLLSRTGVMPTHYIQFLNYATEHLLLRKVGGGYMCVHNLLLEHLASQYAVRKQRIPQRK
jgi:hypothetical protein